jgi:hypothetical protein
LPHRRSNSIRMVREFETNNHEASRGGQGMKVRREPPQWLSIALQPGGQGQGNKIEGTRKDLPYPPTGSLRQRCGGLPHSGRALGEGRGNGPETNRGNGPLKHGG